MKQIKFLLFAMMAVGAVACQSSDLDDVTPDAGSDSTGSTGSTGKVTLTAGTPSHEVVDVDSAALDSRMGVSGGENTEDSLSFTWQNGESEGLDKFTLYDSTGKYLGCFKYVGKDGASVGDFEQYGDDWSEELVDGANYTAVIPASNAATLNEYYEVVKAATKSQAVSWGEVSAVDGNIQLEATFEYDANGANSLSFEHKSVVIKLSLTTEDSFVPNKIKVINSVDATEYDVEIDGGTGSSLFFAIEEGSTALQFELYNDTTLEQVIGYSITDKMSSATLVAGKWYDCVRTSYYDYYRSGVEIDEVTYSRETNAALLSTSGTIDNDSYNYKAVFLDPSATYTLEGMNGVTLIGRYSNTKSEISDVTSSSALGVNQNFICKNVDLTSTTITNYLVGTSSAAGKIVIEDCNITIGAPLFYNNTTASLSAIILDSNKIQMTATSKDLISYPGSSISGGVNFNNNIIYTTDDVYCALLVAKSLTTNTTIDVTNNTIYKYLGQTGTYGFIDIGEGTLTVEKNILWAGASRTSNVAIATYNANRYNGGDGTDDFEDNIVFGMSTSGKDFLWYPYISGTNPTIKFTKETSDPLTYASDGLFTSLVAGYGSTIE